VGRGGRAVVHCSNGWRRKPAGKCAGSRSNAYHSATDPCCLGGLSGWSSLTYRQAPCSGMINSMRILGGSFGQMPRFFRPTHLWQRREDQGDSVSGKYSVSYVLTSLTALTKIERVAAAAAARRAALFSYGTLRWSRRHVVMQPELCALSIPHGPMQRASRGSRCRFPVSISQEREAQPVMDRIRFRFREGVASHRFRRDDEKLHLRSKTLSSSNSF
jgi:hypothetical protein